MTLKFVRYSLKKLFSAIFYTFYVFLCEKNVTLVHLYLVIQGVSMS